MTTWSYSSIKTFDQCPKKYYHLKVAKDVKDFGNAATLYGGEVHKVAEYFIAKDTPVPAKFKQLIPTLNKLKKIPGEKYCELRLAVAFDGAQYAPTKFFAPDVWWRGVADLVVVDGELAYSVDYKTGKNVKYADLRQLDLVAAALFTYFPEVNKIKSALVYVDSNDFIPKEHTRELHKSYYATFEDELTRLSVAEKTNVWNAVSGPLCAYCPVKSCEHNRR
jgi:hypothetical protein